MAKADLTAERLRELLHYDPDTGEFTRAKKLGGSGGANAGNGSLHKTSGYRYICVDRGRHLAHRLAWLYVHGVWPSRDVCHVNGDRADNRISNLLDQRGPRTNNTPSELTAENVRELLDYDPDTGALTWRKSRVGVSPGGRAGKTAIRSNGKRFREVQVCLRVYKAHRVAWLHYYGEWPKGVIDHINGDPADNRIANLRDTDQFANLQNQTRARVDNRSGFLGVELTAAGTYQARIKTRDTRLSLGTYATPEEAHQAYLAAKRRLHEGCTI